MLAIRAEFVGFRKLARVAHLALGDQALPVPVGFESSPFPRFLILVFLAVRVEDLGVAGVVRDRNLLLVLLDSQHLGIGLQRFQVRTRDRVSLRGTTARTPAHGAAAYSAALHRSSWPGSSSSPRDAHSSSPGISTTGVAATRIPVVGTSAA